METEYTGEDLLELFNVLNIEMGNLRPSVINAWFDTDCPKTQHLLNWLCESLSAENFISTQEQLEYAEINALNDTELKKAEAQIQSEFPDILDKNMNEIFIEFKEDEVNTVIDEIERVENLIKINEDLRGKLNTELNEINSQVIQTELSLKQAQNYCLDLSEKLNDLNDKLQEKIVHYANNLYEFEGPRQRFLNNFECYDLKYKFDYLNAYIEKIIGSVLVESINEENDNETVFNISTNKSLANSLPIVRNRILKSHATCKSYEIDLEKQKSILNYLNRFNFNNVYTIEETAFLQQNVDSKENQLKVLYSMMEHFSSLFADNSVCEPSIKHAQQEINYIKSILSSCEVLQSLIFKSTAYYSMLSKLYDTENKDIKRSEEEFKKTILYINRDLKSSQSRAECMKNIISEYNEFEKKPIEESCKLIEYIGKVLKNKPVSIKEALEALRQMKGSIFGLQEDIFIKQLQSTKEKLKLMESNVNVYKQFLICGPTYKFITVPINLNSVLKDLKKAIEKQKKSIKFAVEYSSNIKRLSEKKWENYQRHLWMYFLQDTGKLHFVLQQIEEEVKKHYKK